MKEWWWRPEAEGAVAFDRQCIQLYYIYLEKKKKKRIIFECTLRTITMLIQNYWLIENNNIWNCMDEFMILCFDFNNISIPIYVSTFWERRSRFLPTAQIKSILLIGHSHKEALYTLFFILFQHFRFVLFSSWFCLFDR